LNTTIATKQNNLSTPGAGVFLSGTTLSGYGLRWNASNVPSGGIEELHFNGYTVAQTANFGTGKLELTVGHPIDMATQTWANTQLALKANTSAMTSALATKQPLLSSTTGVINIPGGGLSLSTASASSGYGIPQWQFVAGLTNLMSFGFNVTSAGNNDSPQALVITRVGNVGIGTTNPTQPLDVNGNITCIALTQTSDRSIKENVTDTPLDDLQSIFDSSEVKTYTRTDGVDGVRYGFIAQDVRSKLPDDITNLVFETRAPTPEGEEPGEMLLALDYSRLAATVLWGVCKKQQQAIEALTLRLDALEGKKKKTTKSK
jgi:hypothetical protein